jgi:ferric-dicitrate binding protein FerR (iron transport regulator)
MTNAAPTDRRRLLVGVAAAVLAGTGIAAAAKPVGAVMTATGSAFLERSASRLRAEGGADVLLDDFALTGEASRLELRLGRATRIKLGADAKLKIDRFLAGVRADVELLDGPVFVDHGPGAEPGFTVTSPYGLIAARGTSFFAGRSNGVFGIFVRRGRVDVRTPGGSVSLGAGQGTDISAPGAPPSPPKLWGAPRIAAALASVN